MPLWLAAQTREPCSRRCSFICAGGNRMSKRGAAQQWLGVILLMTFLLVGCGGGGSSSGNNNSNADTNPGSANSSNEGDLAAGTNSPSADSNSEPTNGSNAPPSTAKTCADYSKPAVVNISQPQLYTTLFQFADSAAPFSYPYGRTPESGLVEGPDGSFYGVNQTGGVTANGRAGEGVVYRLTPDGTVTQLHVFEYLGAVGMHGKNPRGGLTLGSDCYLYGTTTFAWGDGEAYQAAVFKLSLEGEITYLAGLHRAIHGTSPLDRLLEGSDGNFYGTSYSGGANYRETNSGTIFKMTPGGDLTALHHFNGTTNGGGPRGTLVEGDDGNFYGVTELGGAFGKGTVYRISSSGVHTLLHSFNGDDGLYPSGGLAKGADGNFYGTTSAGGQHGHGAIFKITPAGTYTILYSFNNTTPALGCNCGVATPRGDLILAEDGFFYGVANLGASHSASGEGGAVYRVSATGHFSPVVYFPQGGARHPGNGLVQGSDGHLYGTSYQGGLRNQGLIYRVFLP